MHDETAELRAEVRERDTRIAGIASLVTTGMRGDEGLSAALTLGCDRLGCASASLWRYDSDGPLMIRRHGERDVSGDGVEATLTVDGAPFGYVRFIARGLREPSFTPADAEFARLLAALMAFAIERTEHARRLDDLAFYDTLTGLPNRITFLHQLELAIFEAQRLQRSADEPLDDATFAVHYCDLDGFKAVNDAFGHRTGDAVLRTVARRLERIAGNAALVARLAGDEFVALQRRVRDDADARRLGLRLQSAFEAPIRSGAGEYALGLSIGIAMYPRDGRDADALLAAADAALYRVKAAGKAGVALSGEGDVA